MLEINILISCVFYSLQVLRYLADCAFFQGVNKISGGLRNDWTQRSLNYLWWCNAKVKQLKS